MDEEIISKYTNNEFALFFDHTQLKPFAGNDEFKNLCSEAGSYGFKMVAVNPAQVILCKKLLEGTPVHVGAAIGFPLGQNTIESKLFETGDAIKNGADEIDYVINISELKNGNTGYIEREMESIVSCCRSRGITSKVIFENCYLEKAEIDELCRIALRVKPDFIKTSTGFGTSGATAEDVKRMKQNVGGDIKVKAAGGIRTLDCALEMISSGAERIGSSASVRILNSFIEKRKGH